jgi:NADH-quinone oxidoreductase subunit M
MPYRTPPHPHDQRALVVALVLIVIWGGNFTLQKYLFDLITPGGFLWARYLIMPVCALLLMRWRMGAWLPPLPRKDWLHMAWLGFIGHSLHVGLVTYGIHWSTAFSSSVILAGVLLKLGTYGFLRFGLYLFPEAAVWAKPLFLTLAVAGILWGAIAATMQKDLKRLVAYSSVAHLGFIVLGTFAFTSVALSGGVMQMVNHGISTGALFLLVGMIYERRHTRQIAELKGLQSVAPIFAAAFMVVMLSSIGVPGLNGFVGEFLILIGSFENARWWVVVGTTGVILAALYLLWAYQRVFHGEVDEANASFPELTPREGMLLLTFIAAIVFTGVYPKPMLDRIEPSVKVLVAHVEERSGRTFEPAVVEIEKAPAAKEEKHEDH